MRGEFSTVVDLDTLRAASNNDLPDEIPVLPKGEFMTLPYGNLVLDDTVFEQMIGNFKAGIRRAVPLDFDHAWENTKAGGWIKELINKADGLWAKVDYNKLGKEAVIDQVYRMISAEWSFDYVDPQKSTHHGAVLVAATLTNRPLMQSMPTITASENNLTNHNGIMVLLNENTNNSQNDMPTIEEILAKAVADRTEEDLKFLEDNKGDLTEQQAKQLQDEAAESGDEETPEEKEQREKEEADAKAKADEEEGDDQTEEVKASELKRLRKFEADHKAAESLKAATDFITPFMASEKGGKVLPAAKDALVQLAQSLNDQQRALLATVLNKTADQKVTETKGKDDNDGKTATEQYTELLTKLTSEGKTPAEANKIIRKEHKATYDAYIAENK